MKKSTRSSRIRWRNPGFIFGVLFAGVLIFSFVASLAITPGTTTTDDTAVETNITPGPTQIIIPTPEDNPQLTLNAPQVQVNGLFQVAVPQGWVVNRDQFEPAIPRARTAFVNSTRFSVIDALVQYGVNYPSTQALSDEFLTTSYFLGEWSEYDSYLEESRSVDEDTVTVDFRLTTADVEVIGRQVAWLVDDWLYMIRIIVPNNNPQLMEAIERVVAPTFIGYEDQRDIQPTWNVYSDFGQGFLIRHPAWEQVSGTPGRPAIFEDPATPSRLVLRVFDGTPLESLEDAENYLTETLRVGSRILASQVTDRVFAERGYLLSYEDRDNEGNAVSGLVAFLNDDSGALYTADIRLAQADVDLLSLDDGSPFTSLRQVVDTFMILPPPDYQQAPVEPLPADALPTPTATATDEPEPTAEPEATSEADAASTEESESATEGDSESTEESESAPEGDSASTEESESAPEDDSESTDEPDSTATNEPESSESDE